MRLAAVLSAVLHVSVVALVYFGVPALFAPDEPVVTPPIPVEVYTVAEKTTPPQAKHEPEPEPEPGEVAKRAPEPTPKPQPEPDPVPPPPEVAETVEPSIPPPPAEPEPPSPPQSADQPEPAPDLPPPPPRPAEAVPTELPPPPPKPVRVAKAEPKAPPEPKPRAKPKPAPKPEPEPEPQPQFNSLLKSLTAKASLPQAPADAEQQAPEPATLELGSVTTRLSSVDSADDEPLSLSVVDAIRRQVQRNWNVPVGAPDASDLVVELHIVLQPDGTVTDVRIVDRARMRREEYFRTMAESARRAVLRASPLERLPPEKYNQWREITFVFTPPV